MFKRVIKEEYKVPADVNYLGEMRDFITRIGRKYGVAERVINTFKLAIDEAGTNIIRHAYRDWKGFITIRILIRDKSVTVSLIDQGHTFDPNNVRDPDLQRYVDIGKKGGLGIFILRRVIDHIDYRKTVEGNELRLTKHRSITHRRHFILPELSITMKTRFSLVASGILTVLVLLGFVWTYVQQGGKILREDLRAGRALARSLAHSSLDPLARDEPETWELAKIATEFQKDHAPMVLEALILDATGKIHGALRTEYILEQYVLPQNVKEIEENVYRYKTPDGDVVYDIVEPCIPEVVGTPEQIGVVHLLLDKSVIDKAIVGSRRRVTFISVMILLLGYIGIFGLVYVTMSPFKRLANWVRALGRDEAHDEMDFDGSDEVGEIAKAFNEITEKFRKSQENLAEQERLQKEMQVAQEIQQMLLPAAFPELEGYEIASYYEAAKDVGGDYFDFVEVDKDTLGIVVADVSGKGVPGSLVMTMIRTALRTEARGNKNAADVLARVNDFVVNDMKRGMFVTVFYIILDSQHRTINYASAGHNPMILFRGSTQKSYYLNPRGFPLGINLPDPTLFRKAIQSDTLRLREGDVLLVYTDGITEAMNPKRDRFGDERLLATVRKYGQLKSDPLVDKIHDEINVFTEEYSQSDDITLVAIREKMKAEDVLLNLRTKLFRLVDKEKMSVKKACETVGVSTSTYYRYKKRYKKMGVKGLKEKVGTADIEEKHISIEDKTKIYDIIKAHPDLGPKRISAELNSEKYGFTEIDDKRIYEELVRSRLNTRELRVAFVERGGKGKKMKPPGTPFLTLDGQIIMEPFERKPAGEEEIADKGVSLEELERQEESMAMGDEDRRPEKAWAEGSGRESMWRETSTEEESDLTDILDAMEVDEDIESSAKDRERIRRPTPDSDMLGGDDVLGGLIREIDSMAVKDQEGGEKDKTASKEFVPMDESWDTEEKEVSGIEEEDQVEDRITASIAGELLGEEMGIFEDTDIPSDREGAVHEEGFLDMMEDLGFDRRTVLSDQTRGARDRSTRAMRELNRKRFLESGLWFYRQGLFAKAIDEFQKAISEDPSFVKAYQCLGDTFFRLGQLDQAREAYERVRHLDPDNVNVLENLGVIFANKGDYKRAVWQWGEVLKRTPDRVDIIDRIKRMQRVIRQRCI